MKPDESAQPHGVLRAEGAWLQVLFAYHTNPMSRQVAYMAQDGNYLDGTPGDANDGRVGLVFRAFDCP